MKQFVLLVSFIWFGCDAEPRCILYGKIVDVQYERKHFCCDKYQVWIVEYSDGSRSEIIRYEDYYQKLHTEYIGHSITKLVDCKSN